MKMSLWLCVFVFHAMDFFLDGKSLLGEGWKRWRKSLSSFSSFLLLQSGFLSSLSLLPSSVHFPPCAINTLYVCPLFFLSFTFPFLKKKKLSHLFILSQTWVWRPLFCSCLHVRAPVSVCECVSSFFLWKKNVTFKCRGMFFFNSTYINTCTGRSK